MKPFIIVSGDAPEFLRSLLDTNPKVILDATKAQGWTLYQSDNFNYWIISDVVKNLTHQFIHYVNPIVYLICNFKTHNYLEILEQNIVLINRDLIKSKTPEKILVIGFNYNQRMHNQMKRKVLEFCILHKIEYLDADKLLEL
jgi:hypothetical protein